MSSLAVGAIGAMGGGEDGGGAAGLNDSPPPVRRRNASQRLLNGVFIFISNCGLASSSSFHLHVPCSPTSKGTPPPFPCAPTA